MGFPNVCDRTENRGSLQKNESRTGQAAKRRPHGLHILRFPASGKAYSFRRSSSPHASKRLHGDPKWAEPIPYQDGVKTRKTPLEPVKKRFSFSTGRGLVGADFTSLASPQAGKLVHSVAPWLTSRQCDSQAFAARQSRRFLFSGSLFPPPAALRRKTPPIRPAALGSNGDPNSFGKTKESGGRRSLPCWEETPEAFFPA